MFVRAVNAFHQGGIVMWPILLLSIAVFALIVERWFYYRRLDRDGRHLSTAFFAAWPGDPEQAQAIVAAQQTLFGRALRAAMACRTDSGVAPVDVVREVLVAETGEVERFLPLIATIASVMPILGLLGTVTGMIETFRVITEAGTGDPRPLASGISQALLTTQAGLVVALPTFLLHTILAGRADRALRDLESALMRVVNRSAAPATATPIRQRQDKANER